MVTNRRRLPIVRQYEGAGGAKLPLALLADTHQPWATGRIQSPALGSYSSCTIPVSFVIIVCRASVGDGIAEWLSTQPLETDFVRSSLLSPFGKLWPWSRGLTSLCFSFPMGIDRGRC